MENWNLEETYRLVESIHGRTSESQARESIRSVFDRQAFARFHYQELVRLTTSFESKYIKKNLLIDLHTSPRGRTRAAFERFIIKAGAHAIAAIKSIHALPDLLAHAIFFSTGHDFHGDPKGEQFANVLYVVKALNMTAEYRELGSALLNMQAGTGWEHLAALSNSSKHRSLTRTSLNEDWTEKRARKRELQFTSFVRKGMQYPPIAVLDLIESEFDRLAPLIIRIGIELNTSLQQMLANKLFLNGQGR